MVAWRRGLLKEGYPNGLRSYIRERMVLDMVNDELEAESFSEVSLNMSALLSTHSAGKPMKGLYDDIYSRIRHSRAKSEYKPGKFRTKDEELRDMVSGASKVYESMLKGGTIEMFDKKVTAIHNRLEREKS
ncbi:MAG: hypothetical protein MJZ17_05280 [Bacteroidales bacterium]|nr:hypothetical protein [Bacteroidales bacterium]